MDTATILAIITTAFGLIILVVGIFAGRYKQLATDVRNLVIEALQDYLPDKKLSPEEVARLQVLIEQLIKNLKK